MLFNGDDARIEAGSSIKKKIEYQVSTNESRYEFRQRKTLVSLSYHRRVHRFVTVSEKRSFLLDMQPRFSYVQPDHTPHPPLPLKGGGLACPPVGRGEGTFSGGLSWEIKQSNGK